jgi:hypothetical protein
LGAGESTDLVEPSDRNRCHRVGHRVARRGGRDRVGAVMTSNQARVLARLVLRDGEFRLAYEAINGRPPLLLVWRQDGSCVTPDDAIALLFQEIADALMSAS